MRRYRESYWIGSEHRSLRECRHSKRRRVGHTDANHVLSSRHFSIKAGDTKMVGVSDGRARETQHPCLLYHPFHGMHAKSHSHGPLGIQYPRHWSFPEDNRNRGTLHYPPFNPVHIPL